MNLIKRLFRRQKAERVFVTYFGGEPPRVPPCPFGCDRPVLRDVIVGVGGEKRDIPLHQPFACEHQEEALRHAAFDQQFEQWYDPNRDEWTVYPRGADYGSH